MTLAVIDVEKEQDKGNDGHGSKVIVIPFDGAALDRDLLVDSSRAPLAAPTNGVDGGNFEPRAPIPYATVQVISNGDSDAVIAEKAAKVLPRANQTDWMRLERTFFLHFGVNTFNEVEWGSGREEPSIFNPTELDANQWLGAMTEFRRQDDRARLQAPRWILLCGPRATRRIRSRPVRGAAARATWCAKWPTPRGRTASNWPFIFRPRTFISCGRIRKIPAGYYGNGSSNVLSVIPTDPASFKSNPAKGRTPPAGFTNYTYVVDDYNRYFLNQLYELLTEYGPIEEVWFDGANPDPSVHETYNYAAWYDLIRQPATQRGHHGQRAGRALGGQ